MRQGHQTCWMFVTIEPPAGPTTIRRWTGRTARGIRKAARAFYAGARLGFGRPCYVNHYGAH